MWVCFFVFVCKKGKMNILKNWNCGFLIFFFFCKLKYFKVVEDIHVEIVV